ncbi:MAG: helix-turn-helix transcriptional regulator [Fimbriimonadaceae bacterium]|jgi:AraC-like DNA-binding protein|nr:helix-turn-helix transcriptional regulator [Fimbriimonadaceae bacterium]
MTPRVLSFAEITEESSILQRKQITSRNGLSASLLTGFASAPALVSYQVGENRTSVLISIAGSALHHSSLPGGGSIQTPMSAAVLGGAEHYHTAFSRGQQKWIELVLEDRALALLADWKNSHRLLSTKGLIHIVRLESDAGFVTPLAVGIWKAYSSSEVDTDAQVVALVAGILDLAGAGYSGQPLASLPESAPESLVTLMKAVKQDPTKAWSLKDAAYMAGYSAFHLSRTFRTLMDYGFPEFVDRCRTERALEFIISSDRSLDEIALSCGFGSTQAMRGACREYVGLLPSEIRSLLLVQ